MIHLEVSFCPPGEFRRAQLHNFLFYIYFKTAACCGIRRDESDESDLAQVVAVKLQ